MFLPLPIPKKSDPKELQSVAAAEIISNGLRNDD